MATKKIQIIDANDLQPVVSANVYHTNNTRKGGVSDFDGFATVETTDVNQSITISYMGYKTQKYPFHSLPPKVKLVTEVGQLPEIVITVPKSKPKNTWVKPVILTALGLLAVSLVGSSKETPPIKTLKM